MYLLIWGSPYRMSEHGGWYLLAYVYVSCMHVVVDGLSDLQMHVVVDRGMGAAIKVDMPVGTSGYM